MKINCEIIKSFRKIPDNLTQLSTLTIFYPLDLTELDKQTNLQFLSNIPNHIKQLDLYGNFDLPIDNLPNSIQILNLCNNFTQPINKLPSELTKFAIRDIFTQLNLPSGLIKCKIGENDFIEK